MSSSFGGFPFPGIPGATAAGGFPLGMMVPHSTTVTSTDGAGAGTGTGTAPLSALTSTPSKAKKANNSNDKKKQLQDRRERAKLHARKCREKKKQELENLQEEEKLLREENLRLRALIRSKMPDQAQNIVSECCYSSERVRHLNPYIFQQAVGEDSEMMTSSSSPTARAAPSSPPAQLGRNDFDLIESLSAGKQSFVITDPRLPDNPIVYCSDSFCELTAYTRKEVIGRNCRFLQTIGTDPRAVDQVRRAIESGADCTTVMLNARSDGTPFWNRFFVAPLRDRRGRIINYVRQMHDAKLGCWVWVSFIVSIYVYFLLCYMPRYGHTLPSFIVVIHSINFRWGFKPKPMIQLNPTSASLAWTSWQMRKAPQIVQRN